MNIATKAALSALSGIKIGGGYAVKGVGKGIGSIGFGLKGTGVKIEQGGDAMAQFGSEMVDSGMLAWKIAGGQLSEEQLHAIVEGQSVEATVEEDPEAMNLANLKEAAKKAAETAMEAVAEVIKESEEKKVEEPKAEKDMTPAEMAEAFC